jgi:hypothetical protein
MQTNIDKTTHIWLTGPMAELLVKVDPEVDSKCTVKEGKKLVLYSKLLKVLYGTLNAALLFWKDLSATLES